MDSAQFGLHFLCDRRMPRAMRGPRGIFPCTLGRLSGRTLLLLCVAPDFMEHNRAPAREAQIWTVQVDVPGVGF